MGRPRTTGSIGAAGKADEELALGEEAAPSASGEQQPREEGLAAKRRVAQPAKKARNVGAGDKEPEFLGEPVPADEACANWPQCYHCASPMRYALDPSPIRLALPLLLPAPVGLMWTRLRA